MWFKVVVQTFRSHRNSNWFLETLRCNSSDIKLRFILFIPSDLLHTEQTNSYMFKYLKKLKSYNFNIQTDYKSLNVPCCTLVKSVYMWRRSESYSRINGPALVWGSGILPYLMVKRLSTCLRSWRIISPMSSTKLPAEESDQRESSPEGSWSGGSPPTCEHEHFSCLWLYSDIFLLAQTDLVTTNWLCAALITEENNTEKTKVKVQ